MKFSLTFKTPDVTDQLNEEQLEEAQPLLDKFLTHGEYVEIEFDTELGTATVQ